MLKFTGTSNIKKYVERVLLKMGTRLQGKTVVDIPAGSGFTSKVLSEQGANVLAYDLFPEFFKVEGLKCEKADLSQQLPIEDNIADMVVFQEGIEHLPNQLFVLQEIHRILKDDGVVLLTTPNVSHLRTKFSYFLSESDLYKRMPANELDALWHSDEGRMYFGHIFLIGIQKLRVLAAASGFRISKLHTVKASTGAILLGFFYPLIVLVNVYAYLRNVRKNDGIDKKLKKNVYKEIIKYNLHPAIQFGKHLFVELEKVNNEELNVHRSSENII